MPPIRKYPGVYVQEIPTSGHSIPGVPTSTPAVPTPISSAPKPISGVPTSVAAFVGYTTSGPSNKAQRVASFMEFEQTFGGLSHDSEVSYAVQQFFLNGGYEAYIVRVPRSGTALPGTTQLIGSEKRSSGIYSLLKADFNLLCIPDATRAAKANPAALDSKVDPDRIYSAALALCDRKRAFLLVDPPPNIATAASAVTWKTGLTAHGNNGAAYFPRLQVVDPLNASVPRTVAPSGTVAGVYARIDNTRGVWKSPAGTEATLNGVQALALQINDQDNASLNTVGLNAIRAFPGALVVWGARTLVGANADASDWKYVAVRRLALFIEESLYRGTQWTVSEPDAEPLWSQLLQSITSFMTTLYRQGALQGIKVEEAFFVKCDATTMTQQDIAAGRVNVLVGFAPVKPAEFVILTLQLKAMPS